MADDQNEFPGYADPSPAGDGGDDLYELMTLPSTETVAELRHIASQLQGYTETMQSLIERIWDVLKYDGY